VVDDEIIEVIWDSDYSTQDNENEDNSDRMTSSRAGTERKSMAESKDETYS